VACRRTWQHGCRQGQSDIGTGTHSVAAKNRGCQYLVPKTALHKLTGALRGAGVDEPAPGFPSDSTSLKSTGAAAASWGAGSGEGVGGVATSGPTPACPGSPTAAVAG
jgi:hypothetical protein